jgi:thymidine kinase
MAGYLKIILGSMFSGKTTELFREYRRHTSCSFKCLIINHVSDKRYNKKKTSTHDGFTINSINVGDKLFDFFKKDDFLSKYQVIFINEGQFFVDLYRFVDYIVNKKMKKVYVCGLDGDFQRKKFGSILDIIPLSDDVIKIKAICADCKYKDAIFTYRISQEKIQTIIGGLESYKPLCRKCYNSLTTPSP